MYLLNGEHKQHLTFLDRGFQYGDGLFETIAVHNGTPVFLEQHLRRLLQGCQRLLISPPNAELLKREALQLIDISEHAVLKIIITRGVGGRGYQQPHPVNPTRILSLHPFPSYPDDYFRQGITAQFCRTQLGLNPVLAGIKHLNRLEQVMARAEWHTADIQEGLMLDFEGNVIAGTMSNFFLVRDNVVYTPVIKNCGVEGILKKIVSTLAKENGIQVIAKNISKQEVYDAHELFVTNSIIGIWPIKQLATQHYKIGTMTRQLQALWVALQQETINA